MVKLKQIDLLFQLFRVRNFALPKLELSNLAQFRGRIFERIRSSWIKLFNHHNNFAGMDGEGGCYHAAIVLDYEPVTDLIEKL